MIDDLVAALADLEAEGHAPATAEIAVLRARVAFAQGRHAEVVAHCRQSLEQGLAPSGRARLAGLGAEAAIELHDTPAAFDLAAAALVASHEGPPDPQTGAAVANHLGAVYRAVGAVRAAATSFQRSLDLDPHGEHSTTATARLLDCLHHLAADATADERAELLSRAGALTARIHDGGPAGEQAGTSGPDPLVEPHNGRADRLRMDLRERAREREERGDLAGALADEQQLLRLNRQQTCAQADGLVEQIVLRASMHAGRREAEATEEKLRAAALVDPLTRLLNRRGLDAALAVTTLRGAVLMVDIDHFKWINDRFGHGAGDDVLVHMALVLADALREGDLLCRYGGEEFLAVLPGADLAEATLVGDRLRAAAAGHDWDLVVAGLDVVTVSVGVAGSSGRGARAAARDADRALYRAKRAGRNRVAVSDART